MVSQGYAAYKNASIDTADQSKLILIAYDVAIKNCKLALEVFDDYHELEKRTKLLFKVQDAITELMGALNLDTGEIAKNLYKLYDYMLRSIVDASVKNRREKIAEVLQYLEELREAWAKAAVKVKKETISGVNFNNTVSG